MKICVPSSFCVWLMFCSFACLPLAAEETKDEDEALMEIFKSDPKSPPPEAATPSEVTAMLEKWKAYEQAQTEVLHKRILETRNVVCEILSKKALEATAAVREQLLKEVEEIKALPPDEEISRITGKDETRSKALLGVWKPKDQTWTRELFPRGKMIARAGTFTEEAEWHWIDPEAGVFAMGDKVIEGSPFLDLLWLEKPGSLRLVNCDAYRTTLSKLPGSPAPTTDAAIIKANSDEAAQRAALTQELDPKRKKVVTWLLDRAKKLPSTEVTDLLQELRRIEAVADEKAWFPSKLAGLWYWDRSELTFQPYGIIASKEGRKLGRWGWVEGKHNWFAVVLNGGKNAADIYIAKPPKDASQTSIDAHRMVGAHIPITRTLPK